MPESELIRKIDQFKAELQEWQTQTEADLPPALGKLPDLLDQIQEMLQSGKTHRLRSETVQLEQRRRMQDARLETEQLFFSLFQNNHAVMLLIDPATGAIMNANPAACHFYGYSFDELTRLKITALNVLSPVQVFQEMERAREEQRHHFYFRHRLANGEIREVEVFSGPVRFDGRGLLYSIVFDITERTQAQEAMKAYALQLENSNRELQKFAFVAAHDLQEPLRKIQIFGDRLRVKSGVYLDEGGQRDLERMQEAAARMQAMIHSLRAYSQVMSRPPHFQPVNLNTIAQLSIQQLQERIEALGGTIEVDDLPSLEGEEGLLKQLFFGLLDNGLKFQRPGIAPRLKITCRRLPAVDGSAPERVEISFMDNGIGLPEMHLNSLFQPFQRHHRAIEPRGVGMTLAICSKIVDRHRGSIRAANLPSQGAVFIVTLPLEQKRSDNTPLSRPYS